MNVRELGESINSAGREFKAWFTDFTLVYTPIFVLVGILMTGFDLYVNVGIADTLWFKVPWAAVQVLAVDGLWFAVWIRILTDEYKWSRLPYHVFIVLLGLVMTCIGIVMTDIVFFQEYMSLSSSTASMNLIGIPVGLFLHSRAILLMLTATLAIVLDKVMRSNTRYKASTAKVHVPKPKPDPIPEPRVESISETRPRILALPEPKPTGYKEQIRSIIEKFNAEGRPYTYQDIADAVPCSVQTVKVHAPKIKKELAK